MTESAAKTDDIGSAEILLPGKPLSDTLSFFTDELGFRIEMIYPADAPRVATVSGYGVRIRLDAGLDCDPGTVLLKRSDPGKDSGQQIAPNGTTIAFAPVEEPVALPAIQSSLVVTDAGDGDGFGEGRAGMQ